VIQTWSESEDFPYFAKRGSEFAISCTKRGGSSGELTKPSRTAVLKIFNMNRFTDSGATTTVDLTAQQLIGEDAIYFNIDFGQVSHTYTHTHSLSLSLSE
jgi:hypothetical protein